MNHTQGQPHKNVDYDFLQEPTPEMLEKRLAVYDRQIAHWKPRTAWDAANQRELRYIKKHRTACEQAARRLENEIKERAIRERRERILPETLEE